MTIPPRLDIVTLGVADLPRSAAFYEALGWRRSDQSSDAIVWFALGGAAIGLFPREELAADIGLGASGSGGFGGVTLAVNVGDEASVDAALATALRAGGTIVKHAQHAQWGGYHGYFSDPDGHYWEVAHNPFVVLRDGLPVL